MIKKLSPNLIEKIAAGEILTKPLYAIKELLDNAIDAKATEISIYIEENGLKKIIVADNGVGMSQEDLKICKEMHTSSKTLEEDTIFGLNFLGFRGEALASINAVSNLTIESNGMKNIKNSITYSTYEKGTKITIDNIFEKTPARLKFLKNNIKEHNDIKQLIKSYAINYFDIKFNFFNNKKAIYNFSSSTEQEKIYQIFKEEGLFFENKLNNLKIHGYILKKHQKESYIFINKRLVKDKAIFTYIKSIFKEFFMINEEPSYIIKIEMDPFLIDFNVHPNKLEIKLVSYSEIFSLIVEILNNNLFKKLYEESNLKSDLPEEFLKFDTPLENNLENSLENNIDHAENSRNFFRNFAKNNFKYRKTELDIQETEDESLEFVNESQVFFKTDQYALQFQDTIEQNFKIIGQIKNSFIIFETENGIGIFDQHAAHERKLYESMKEELKFENKQKLLFPINLNLTLEQELYIANNLEIFKNKGIIIENNKIIECPNFLHHINFKNFIEEQIQPNIECNIMINKILANIACKNALKANAALSFDQMHSLLKESIKNVPICNHGRPVFKYFSNYEIINWFKRT